MPQTYSGGCHCQAIRFTVEVDEKERVVCNCSICHMKGYWHVIVPARALTIHRGRSHLTEYRFGTRTAQHLSCASCGITPFYVPRSHPDGWSVNGRCFDDPEEVATWPEVPFDGRHWEDNIHTLR